MSKRSKRKARLQKWYSRRNPSAPPQERLSNTWYTQDQVLKLLSISISTCYRLRVRGILIASKWSGKLYYNEYHVQKMLIDGLPKNL